MKCARNLECRIAVLLLILMNVGVTGPAVAETTDQVLTSYINAVNASMPPSNKTATIAALFEPGAVQYHMNPGIPNQKGGKEIQQFFAGFSDSFADWTHVEKSRVIQGNRAVWEGTAQGHDKGTGKFLSLPIVFILEFGDQGLVKENRVYVDIQVIPDQLK